MKKFDVVFIMTSTITYTVNAMDPDSAVLNANKLHESGSDEGFFETDYETSRLSHVIDNDTDTIVK